MVMSPTRDSSHDAAISEQHVQLARMLGQSRGKVSERAMYYRKPPTGSEAGWIVVNGTNPERQAGLFMKGFVPLQQYGFVDPQSIDHEDPSYRTWSKLLLAPGGAAEFPVEQLIAYRWYDPDICPVPSARFPQLEGVKIAKFWCPECEGTYYHKATHLGRHLRVQHEYDRAEIAAYGAEAGINFAKEISGARRAVETVEYLAPPEPEPALPMPKVDVEEFGGRRPGRPRKDQGDI